MSTINFSGHELTGSPEAIKAFNDYMVNRSNADCERMDKAQRMMNKMQMQINELQQLVGSIDESIIDRLVTAVKRHRASVPSERHAALEELNSVCDEILEASND